MKENFKKQLEVMGEFFGHIVVGVLMFIGMLVGGAAMKYAVVFLHPLICGHASHEAMEILETVFLWADVVFLSWWCIFSTYKACKALIKLMRKE